MMLDALYIRDFLIDWLICLKLVIFELFIHVKSTIDDLQEYIVNCTAV